MLREILFLIFCYKDDHKKQRTNDEDDLEPTIYKTGEPNEQAIRVTFNII